MNGCCLWVILVVTGLSHASQPEVPFKPPLIMIPGFASSRLRSWSSVDCPNSVIEFQVGDPVWLTLAKVIGANSCWLACMKLDPITQADSQICKIRPDQGLDAIAELEPGLVTGSLSRIWRTFIDEAVIRFGYTPFDLIAVPYDFRLAPSVLQERDDYFDTLRLTIESARRSWKKRNGNIEGGVVILCHSMGNSVFRYFLEWLKLEFDHEHDYQEWLDEHIGSYIAVGAPFLGAVEALKAAISGLTFGLPISETTARELSTSFSATPWMFPFVNELDMTKYARDLPQPPLQEIMEVRWADPLKETSFYKPNDILSGRLFKDLAHFDPISGYVVEQMKRYYKNDQILNPLSLWERPPLKRIFCIYGVGLSTPSKYVYSQSKISNRTWKLTAEQFGNGDGTVPYSSLSWCHTWLGSHVNITTIPQRTVYIEEEVEVCYNADRNGNCEHSKEAEIRVMGDKSVIFEHHKYESFIDRYGEKQSRRCDTAVWEMDAMEHRSVIQSSPFLFELTSEFAYQLEMQFHKYGLAKREEHGFFEVDIDSGFSNRLRRQPKTNDDCYWDYYSAACYFPDHCEYRYAFGDIHLGQSCRIKILEIDYPPQPTKTTLKPEELQPGEPQPGEPQPGEPQHGEPQTGEPQLRPKLPRSDLPKPQEPQSEYLTANLDVFGRSPFQSLLRRETSDRQTPEIQPQEQHAQQGQQVEISSIQKQQQIQQTLNHSPSLPPQSSNVGEFEIDDSIQGEKEGQIDDVFDDGERDREFHEESILEDNNCDTISANQKLIV